MELIEQLAEAALRRENLRMRSLVQDLLHSPVRLSDVPRPSTHDPRMLSVAAAIIELLAQRQDQQPPAWAKEIGPLANPFYLLESAEQMKRLRALCETQAPEPMRKRRLYAPPHFLEFA